MPMHDWTKVEADVYHDFSLNWMVVCVRAINRSLPDEYYALIERSISKQKRIAIRQNPLEQVVAIVELVSPGNKSSDEKFRRFRNKIASCIRSEIHAIVIDPFPPTPRDPKGIHASIWKSLTGNPPKTSKSRPLTNVSYEAAFSEDVAYYCYSKPGSVGQPSPELPLFLQPGYAVAIDFEEIYNDAYTDVLPRFREQLEG